MRVSRTAEEKDARQVCAKVGLGLVQARCGAVTVQFQGCCKIARGFGSLSARFAGVITTVVLGLGLVSAGNVHSFAHPGLSRHILKPSHPATLLQCRDL